MFGINNIISFVRSSANIAVSNVRFIHHRRVIRRFGYTEKYHAKGLLPRIKDEKLPICTIPTEKRADPWRDSVAMFGRNDYIDILGDGRIDPTQLMGSIPRWLRKFKGNEMQMLIRRRIEKAHWKWSRPQKWHHLTKRIDYLYKKLNYKKEPKRPQY